VTVKVGGIAPLRFEALGSDCELYAVAPQEPLEATAGWIRSLHDRLTRFSPHSELSRFNALAGEWVDVSPELEALLRAALDAFEESGGLVNVAILPALVAAGYDRTFEEVIAAGGGKPHSGVYVFRHQPDDERHRVDGMTHAPVVKGVAVDPLPSVLQVKRRTAQLKKGAAIDLGGIAKGWIADRAVERLGPNSLANCGGDLHAVGGGPTGDGWPVAFGGKTLLLDAHGAATSGTTKRRWGDGRHHIVDPRAGLPARTDLAEVSVLARTALGAEVLAKTALLLGREKAEAALEGRALAWALA
jgi:thiamine biosynthesis lipoprotein